MLDDDEGDDDDGRGIKLHRTMRTNYATECRRKEKKKHIHFFLCLVFICLAASENEQLFDCFRCLSCIVFDYVPHYAVTMLLKNHGGY